MLGKQRCVVLFIAVCILLAQAIVAEPHTIDYISPVDAVMLNSSVDFTFTLNSNSSLSCELYVDADKEAEQVVTPSEQTVIPFTVFIEGSHTWYIACNGTVNPTKNFTTDYSPPSKPSLQVIKAEMDGSVFLNWTDVSDAVKYHVYRDTDTIFNADNLDPIATVTDSIYTDTTPEHETRYNYAISAVDEYGRASGTSTSRATTARDRVKPEFPYALNGESAGGKISLSWPAVEYDITGGDDSSGLTYSVWYTPTSKNISELSTITTRWASLHAEDIADTEYSFDFPGSDDYYFFVTTKDDAGNENIDLSVFNQVTLTQSYPQCGDGSVDGGGCMCANELRTTGYCCSNVYHESEQCEEEEEELTGYAKRRKRSSNGGSSGSADLLPAEIAKKFNITLLKAVPNSLKRVWVTIEKGKNQTLTFDDTSLPLHKMFLIPKENTSNLRILITDTALPEEVPKPEHTIYKTFEITGVNLDKTVVNAQLRVNESWLSEKNVPMETVSLYRYTDTWEKIPTTLLGTKDGFIIYEVEFPGFSFFSITGIEKSIKRVETPIEEAKDSSVRKQTTVTPPKLVKKEEPVRKPSPWLVLMGIVYAVVVLDLGLYTALRIKRRSYHE